uniref:RING-type domain-containing protein n=1 Tax=viral metagenome TaxID=1070528 RepID=A0A6C0BJ93_9ZZZZ
MECSICCDEIVASTGQVTLGCSHQFHLGCVGRWLLKSSTCPMCRGETCSKEKILAEDEMIDFEEEEEEDEEEEEEEDNIPEFDEAALALWTMRRTFEMLEEGQSIEVVAAAPLRAKEDSVSHVHFERSMQASALIWRYAEERGYDSA